METTQYKKTVAQHITECAFLLLLGAVGYYGIELCYRGYSHWTMALCGGVAMLLIYRYNELHREQSLLCRALVGGSIISVIELIAGCILNLWLRLEIWDYSGLPLHLWGQICLPYSLLWILFSLPLALLSTVLRRHLFLAES